MPKTVKGFRWVRLTDEQYQKCVEMSEPDTRSAKNQFEPVSLVVGWCVDQMADVPFKPFKDWKESLKNK